MLYEGIMRKFWPLILLILLNLGISFGAEPKKEVYFLEGIVILRSQEKLAIVYEEKGKEKGIYHELKEGDELGEYTVKRIEKDKIILRKKDKEWELPLHGAFKGEVKETRKETKKEEFRVIKSTEPLPEDAEWDREAIRRTFERMRERMDTHLDLTEEEAEKIVEQGRRSKKELLQQKEEKEREKTKKKEVENK